MKSGCQGVKVTGDTPVALTDLGIRKAKAAERPFKLCDSLGVFVLVKPNGSKFWRQKYVFGGKERLVAHGAHAAVSLREARQKRDDIREILAAFVDPAVQKRLADIEAEAKARTTLLHVAEDYLKAARDRDLAPATMQKQERHVRTLAEATLTGSRYGEASSPGTIESTPVF